MDYKLIDYVKDIDLFRSNYKDIMNHVKDFSYMDIIDSLKFIFKVPKCIKVYEYWDYYNEYTPYSSLFIRICDCSTKDFNEYHIYNTLTGECMICVNKVSDHTLSDVYDHAQQLAKGDLSNYTWWMCKCYYKDFEYLLILILMKYNSGEYRFGLVGLKNKYLIRNSIREELKIVKRYGNNRYFPRFGIKKKAYIKNIKIVKFKIRKKKGYGYGL